ncbi:Gfo/Idh/MocA family protein [Puniceicoccus vermicola]|uniref:Gfo/Idh/MocA family oxidoreductase n=1 Tax=Puniceicoccus vermicola TaxID=388746 RepID=A0A7X1AX28_9BACT|nr:Gfo/Idh/MocA family oxidoreductase [Puniceicoccus vermicola]MBC2601598.1 Gfo/Idh/MocA family oxidoreductase [Puniceicoccus vermicola]
MTEQILRIGIVGAGGNSRLRHIPGFQEIEGVEVTGVVNRSRASSEEAAKEFDIPRVFEDWQSLVSDPEIDAVCIGTWPYLHREVTIAALRAGKHVLCEARMARNLAEAQEMALVASEHGDQVAQIVPSPFTLGDDEWIASRIAKGVLGNLLEVRSRFLNGALLDPKTPMNWRLDSEMSGKNTMVMGILHEAILRWVDFPDLEVTATAGFGAEKRPDENGELQPTVIPESLQIVAFPSSGPRLVYDLSQLHGGEPENSICINGEKGSLLVDLAAGKIVLAVEGEEPVVRTIEDAWDVEGEFVRSIREGTPVTRTNFTDGLKYMAFTEAVWESWNAESAVPVGQ